MPITNKNIPVLHRKEWQMMSPPPFSANNGRLFLFDQTGNSDLMLAVDTNTQQWIYSHKEDSYAQIPSGNLVGQRDSGASGMYYPWSITYTANGGSTLNVTVSSSTHNITGFAVGATIEFISSGSNTGVRRKIAEVIANAGTGNVTLVLDSVVPTAVLNTHTFRLSTGRFYVFNAGSVSAGNWKAFDVATLNWSSNLSITNLPFSWGTDGKLACAYALEFNYATGTATSGAASSLTNSVKTWATNQWCNYQVRITSGTGIGQIRTISSNTSTVLTVGSAWTTIPDATSQYAIEGNEDFLYLLGNNAITLYRYSISANTWSVMAPTTARAGAASNGMSADFILKTGNSTWADESNIQDGRYLYSLRGAGSALIDRFDIAGGTAGAGAWANAIYPGTEAFTSGSNACVSGNYLYIKKDSSNRFFKFSVTGNHLEPLSINFVTDGIQGVGQRLWVKNIDEAGTVKWLYSVGNNLAVMYRLMLY